MNAPVLGAVWCVENNSDVLGVSFKNNRGGESSFSFPLNFHIWVSKWYAVFLIV